MGKVVKSGVFMDWGKRQSKIGDLGRGELSFERRVLITPEAEVTEQ